MELCAPPGAQTSFSCWGSERKVLCRSLDEHGSGNGGLRHPTDNKTNHLNLKRERKPKVELARFSRLELKYRDVRHRKRRGAQQGAGCKAVTEIHRHGTRRHRSLQGLLHGAASAKNSRPPPSAPRRRISNTRTTGSQSSSSLSRLTLVTASGEDACADSPEISHAGGIALFLWPHCSHYEKQNRASALLLVSNVAGGVLPDMCVRRGRRP